MKLFFSYYYPFKPLLDTPLIICFLNTANKTKSGIETHTTAAIIAGIFSRPKPDVRSVCIPLEIKNFDSSVVIKRGQTYEFQHSINFKIAMDIIVGLESGTKILNQLFHLPLLHNIFYLEPA